MRRVVQDSSPRDGERQDVGRHSALDVAKALKRHPSCTPNLWIFPHHGKLYGPKLRKGFPHPVLSRQGDHASAPSPRSFEGTPTGTLTNHPNSMNPSWYTSETTGL